jgi:S1 RNA binding domain protein
MAIEVGTKLEGKVTGITNFGAFVELPGGVTGLVHISEIADNYVKDVNDHLKISDIVTVKVINVDKDGKIGLSIRKAVDRPAGDRYERSGGFRRDDRGDRGYRSSSRASFDDKLSKFLRDSEERMSSLKKHTDSKRGGRGAKRY